MFGFSAFFFSYSTMVSLAVIGGLSTVTGGTVLTTMMVGVIVAQPFAPWFGQVLGLRGAVLAAIGLQMIGQVLGFVGRRNPAIGEDVLHAGPKYLNTPTTPLFSKGNQLYGTVPELCAEAATPVLVEGPIDAHAITLATRGMYVGLAPLGAALSGDQAAQLTHLGGPVIVATDADLAGRMAAERAHWLLAQHNVPTFHTPLPEGTDPAAMLHDHGADAVTGAILGSCPRPTRRGAGPAPARAPGSAV